MTIDIDRLRALSERFGGIVLSATEAREVIAEVEELRTKLIDVCGKVNAALDERDELSLKLGRAHQAMFDAYKMLGFDTDGDDNPRAWVAGMGDDGYVESWLRYIRTHVDDLKDERDEADGIESRLAGLLDTLTGGRISKSHYSIPTMVQVVEAAFAEDRRATEDGDPTP